MMVDLLSILLFELGRVRIDAPLRLRVHVVLRYVLELVTLLLLTFLKVLVFAHLLASFPLLHVIVPALAVVDGSALLLFLLHNFLAFSVDFGYTLLVFVNLLPPLARRVHTKRVLFQARSGTRLQTSQKVTREVATNFMRILKIHLIGNAALLSSYIDDGHWVVLFIALIFQEDLLLILVIDHLDLTLELHQRCLHSGSQRVDAHVEVVVAHGLDNVSFGTA